MKLILKSCVMMFLFILVSSVVNAETVDVQVSANADDAYEVASNGAVLSHNGGGYLYFRSNTDPGYRYWAGLRWALSSPIPQGSTINAAYIELSIRGTSYDDPNGYIHFERSASPSQFSTSSYDISSRSRTTASTPWIQTGIGENWQSTPSLVAPLQELVDSYSPSSIVAIFRPNTNNANSVHFRGYEYLGLTYSAKLHINYTPGASGPDTTPPIRSNGLPMGTLAAGTTQTTISLTTNEAASCRYSTTAGVSYASMANTFSTTGGVSHSGLVSGLSNGSGYSYYVRCLDAAGNSNTDDLAISFSVALPTVDTTPPARSNGQPTGTLPAGTTQISISLTTNEVATCRYSAVAGVSYASMANTFSTTGGVSHSGLVSGLSNGSGYSYYVRCLDAAGNANTNDFTISFSVATIPSGTTIIVDHTSTGITQIPQEWMQLAKDNLHIGYAHQSHGGQIVRGMDGLDEFANIGGKGLALPTNFFLRTEDGAGDTLDMETNANPDLAMTASLVQYPTWPQRVRTYLNSHPDVNVFMLAWSYDIYEAVNNGDLDVYIAEMSRLESEYPNVRFVYQTGTRGWPHSFSQYTLQTDSDIKEANQRIRDYVIANNKVLYDFGDIESWNPDGVYYEFADDACNYYDSATDLVANGNWCTEWQNSHVQNSDWYYVSAQHTQPLNGNLKAYAAWWLWARLAGWDGGTTTGDITPPVRSNGLPSGTLAAGTNQTIISLNTNENATCRYSTTGGVSYAAMTGAFTTTGGTYHSRLITGLSDGTSYSYYVKCNDTIGNENANDFNIFFSVSLPMDITPPARSNAQPTGTLPAGNSQTTISLITDESAACKYSTIAGQSYDSISNIFTTTGGTYHSTPVNGLTDGNSYTYYVRCRDSFNNQNTDDFLISFSIGLPVPDTTPPTISSVTSSATTPYSTLIAWVTDELADSQVEYGLTELLGLFSNLYTNYVSGHSIILTNLVPSTNYYYTVKSKDIANNSATSNISSFTTSTDSLLISFIPPTPDNGAVISRNWTVVNVSVTSTHNTSSFINWNNTLVGYWDFNDGTAADKSTNGNNGTLFNGPQQVAGKFGNALQFDGVNDYIDFGGCNKNLPLNNYPTKELTITAWVKLDSTFSSTGRVIGKLGSDVTLYVWGNRAIRGKIVNTAGTPILTAEGTALNTNQWYFVAMRYNGSEIKVFLDGASYSSARQSGAIRNPHYVYQIGGYVFRCSGRDYGERFNGVLDEVTIWKRALSEQEIRALYNTQTNALSNIFTNQTDGTYHYYAYTTDTDGNSAQTETMTLTIDTTQ